MKTKLDFLVELRGAKIYFTLECILLKTIMARVDVPGERWEVGVFLTSAWKEKYLKMNKWEMMTTI